MFKKSKILIIISVVTLVLLTILHGKLIYNTYQLKEKLYLLNAKSEITKIYNSKEIDDLLCEIRNEVLKQSNQLVDSNYDQKTVLLNIKKKSDSINLIFNPKMESKLKERNLNFIISIDLTEFEISDTSKTIAKLIEKGKDNPIFILGRKIKANEEIKINEITWQKELKPFDPSQHYLTLKNRIVIKFNNWNMLIFRDMFFLLFSSFILYAIVIGLLYFSIFNLYKNKRLADIKTDFINNITHELKTPLTTLSITTKTLNKQLELGYISEPIETLQIIDRQNERLQKLIDQVLQNSLGFNDLKISLDDINVQSFLKHLISDFKITLNPNQTIDLTFFSDNQYLLADRFLLTTALTNILDNAAKFGSTRIDVKYDFIKNKGHYISISDNGIGIDQQDIKYVFEKFFRVSENNKHNYKGLGLGLYFAKQIVLAHQGNIKVDSKKGKGTNFTIFIP